MLIAAAAAFASAAGGRHGEVGTDAQQPPTHPPEDREEAMPVSLLLFFGAALAAGAVLWTGLVAPADDDHDAKSRPSRAAGTSTDVDPTTLPASSPPLRRHRAWSSPGRLDATAETSPAQTAPLVFAGDVPARTARRGDLEAIEAENAALREHISVMQGSLDHAALGLLQRGIDDLVAQREEVGGQLARLLHGAPAAARPAGGPSSPRSAASPLESGAATRIQAQQRGATARRAAAAAELEAGVVAIELQIEFLRGQEREISARVSEHLDATGPGGTGGTAGAIPSPAASEPELYEPFGCGDSPASDDGTPTRVQRGASWKVKQFGLKCSAAGNYPSKGPSPTHYGIRR